MRFVAVDWSGAKDPRGKIWLASASAGRVENVRNCPTRESAVERIQEAIVEDDEVVVGLDFAFSAPAWFLGHVGCASSLELWDAARTQGDRWLSAPPFYTRGNWKSSEFRTQRELRETDLEQGNVASLFKIIGAKQVGRGSIKGMPALADLRNAGFAIWPFEPARLPLVVEIYPRAFYGSVVKSDPAERRRFLERSGIAFRDETDRARAADSDDAFDAAVSAWAMTKHEGDFRSLRPLGEPYSVEGKIWLPRSGEGATEAINDRGKPISAGDLFEPAAGPAGRRGSSPDGENVQVGGSEIRPLSSTASRRDPAAEPSARVPSVPTISRFYGIEIQVYRDDHPPPHFHATYAEFEAKISIENLELLAGSLPRRALAIVIEWAMMHRPELRENWARALRHEPALQIAPLDGGA